MREITMTKPLIPAQSAAGFGTPDSILAQDFASLAPADRKVALLLAAESGCLARLARQESLTKTGMERVLSLDPVMPRECSYAPGPASQVKGDAFSRRICEAFNAARRVGGYPPGGFFTPDWAAIERDLDRNAGVVRENTRQMVRLGWLESRRDADNGRRVVIAIPQATIVALGLEP